MSPSLLICFPPIVALVLLVASLQRAIRTLRGVRDAARETPAAIRAGCGEP